MKFSHYYCQLFVIILILRKISGQCSIDIRSSLNRTASGTPKEPLFLKYSRNQYELMIPSDGILKFQKGESALIACTTDNRKNNLTLNEKPSSTIICERGNKFNINSNEYTIAEFNECSQIISGNVINRNIQCGNDGVFFNIGFNLPDSKGFVNLIAVCYSKKRGSAIFTSHVLYGKTIKSAMKSSARPSTFKTSEIPAKVSAPTSFTKAKQLERFSDIFGSRAEAEGFLNETYLARGHLTPDGDMIFVSWQWSTYYYLNVVPQFQKINNGNFKHIESIVRTKAAQLQSNLNIYTGAFDVLKLKNKKITLDPDGLEVPKWIWKIVKDEERDIGIAFVTLNNPYASSVTNICNDVCNDYGWDWKDRKVFSKGYSICCSIADLKNVINYLPPNVDVGNVLEK